ncbi:MAG: hypothetical protein HY898_04650 [Deltaproteobacteria bacterium]|nr:hypothetical protein [Deltaproteobacteria bacterium]
MLRTGVHWILPVCVTLCLISISCGGAGIRRFDEIMASKVRTQAAFVFECPQESLVVTKIDSGSYGVSGCGKRATYVGKDSRICWAGNSESNLQNYCQVVSDTMVRDRQ